MKHLVGHTKNNALVHVDLILSPAARHIANHPHLLNVIKEALLHTNIKGAEYRLEYDLARVIGYENVVQTSTTDKIMYARLIRDPVYSRFTKKGEPKHSTYISILLELQDDDSYDITDAWIGRLRPPRPGSSNEQEASKEYWENHAFLLDSQVLQPRTSTTTCPY